jgi:hypothetical protein
VGGSGPPKDMGLWRHAEVVCQQADALKGASRKRQAANAVPGQPSKKPRTLRSNTWRDQL